MVTPSCRREVVSYLRSAYGVSERRACRTIGMSRASYRYRSVADPQSELRLHGCAIWRLHGCATATAGSGCC